MLLGTPKVWRKMVLVVTGRVSRIWSCFWTRNGRMLRCWMKQGRRRMLRSESSCGHRGLGVEQWALSQQGWADPSLGLCCRLLQQPLEGRIPRWGGAGVQKGGVAAHIYTGDRAASGTHVCPSPPFVTMYVCCLSRSRRCGLSVKVWSVPAFWRTGWADPPIWGTETGQERRGCERPAHTVPGGWYRSTESSR